MQELTQDNLKTVVSEHDTVVVQYSATWSGNCRIMKPKMKKFQEELGVTSIMHLSSKMMVDDLQTP